MSTPGSIEVLRLYRDLLRYGKQLKLTDVKYYSNRIRTEFRNNKTLTSAKDIEFNFKVRFIFALHDVDFGSISLFSFLWQKGEALLKNKRIV